MVLFLISLVPCAMVLKVASCWVHHASAVWLKLAIVSAITKGASGIPDLLHDRQTTSPTYKFAWYSRVYCSHRCEKSAQELVQPDGILQPQLANVMIRLAKSLTAAICAPYPCTRFAWLVSRRRRGRRRRRWKRHEK